MARTDYKKDDYQFGLTAELVVPWVSAVSIRGNAAKGARYVLFLSGNVVIS
jgi:hypothetical protein